jgi:hypothetical protein
MVKTALTVSMTARRLDLAPRTFGRRRPFVADAATAPAPVFSDDMKLFATTYIAGFLFVWLYLI